MTIQIENEIEIIAKVTDFTGIARAFSAERHEQYQTRMSSSHNAGSIRVRKTTKNKVDTYTASVKVERESDGQVQKRFEKPDPITAEFFNMFKNIAPKVSIKDRFMFELKRIKIIRGVDEKQDLFITVPDVLWEVDFYKDPNDPQKYCEYCRIELEIDKLESVLKTKYPELKKYDLHVSIKNIPLVFGEYFTKATATPEQQKTLDYLYKNVFSRDN